MDSPTKVPQTHPLAGPIILVLIAATHLAYAPLAALREVPVLLSGFALAMLLGGAYAITAWLARRGRGFKAAVNLIVGENLGVLAVGFVFGYPWADYLRPGTLAILGLQLAFCFAEIIRRQEAGQPIVPASRLAWFVVAYALAFTAYTVLKPEGLWAPSALI